MFLPSFRSLNVTESKTLWGDDLVSSVLILKVGSGEAFSRAHKKLLWQDGSKLSFRGVHLLWKRWISPTAVTTAPLVNRQATRIIKYIYLLAYTCCLFV